MSQTDPIADMLTRLRNAHGARHEVMELPFSRIKSELARILKKEGYIKDFTSEGQGPQRVLRLFLKYSADMEPAIQGLTRVSKPGLRQYTGAATAPRVLGGLGIAVLSTSSGLMTDREARSRKVGGEILCKIW